MLIAHSWSSNLTCMARVVVVHTATIAVAVRACMLFMVAAPGPRLYAHMRMHTLAIVWIGAASLSSFVLLCELHND